MATQTLNKREQSDVKRSNPDQIQCFQPATDIRETSDAILLRFDMPGVSREHVDLTIEKGVLTVSGQADPEAHGTPVYRETRIGNYCRTFSLSDDVDPNGIRAEMTDGVLTVNIPRPEQAKPKRIQIQCC